MYLFEAVLWLLTTCHGVTSECNDIDTMACELMIKQNPGLCSDEQLSTSACPRYCKKCPLMCYHCDNVVTNYLDCNATQECSMGERCMLHELSSSADGHHEYKMTCASVKMCDGTELTIPFGRRDIDSRDISAKCCTDDLCNYPIIPNVVTTVPTAAPVSTVCNRDIMVMMETETPRSHSETDTLVNFVKEVTSSVTIGPNDNLVGVTLYSHNTHEKIHFSDHMDKQSLLTAMDHLGISQSHIDIDYHDVEKFITKELIDPSHGDRSAFEDVVIIFVDHYAHIHHDPHHSTHYNSIPNRKVIVVDVGFSTAMAAFGNLATDANHVLHVNDYNALMGIKDSLLNLICS